MFGRKKGRVASPKRKPVRVEGLQLGRWYAGGHADLLFRVLDALKGVEYGEAVEICVGIAKLIPARPPVLSGWARSLTIRKRRRGTGGRKLMLLVGLHPPCLVRPTGSTGWVRFFDSTAEAMIRPKLLEAMGEGARLLPLTI